MHYLLTIFSTSFSLPLAPCMHNLLLSTPCWTCLREKQYTQMSKVTLLVYDLLAEERAHATKDLAVILPRNISTWWSYTPVRWLPFIQLSVHTDILITFDTGGNSNKTAVKRPTPHPCSWPTPLSTRSLKMEKKKKKEAVYLEVESQVTEWRKEWFWKVWFARQPTDSCTLGQKIIRGKEVCLALKEPKSDWLLGGWGSC